MNYAAPKTNDYQTFYLPYTSFFPATKILDELFKRKSLVSKIKNRPILVLDPDLIFCFIITLALDKRIIQTKLNTIRGLLFTQNRAPRQFSSTDKFTVSEQCEARERKYFKR